MSFIDEHRDEYGGEPICTQLPIVPSTYYFHKAREHDITKVSARQQRDQALIPHIQKVWEENFRIYGARKIWRQLQREGVTVISCTIERPMQQFGIQGVSGERNGSQQSVTRSKTGHLTWYGGNLHRLNPISYGLQISHVSPRGPALSMLPLLLTRMPAALLAGAYPGR